MHSHQNVTGGIVLAGGRSARMGRDKATLDWHGTPLVVHVARVLAALTGHGPVVVVHRPGQALPVLEDAELAADPEPDRGPLMGLRAGLEALRGRAELALVAATDQPFLTAAVFTPLLAVAAGADAAAWTTQERPQPLGAVYRVDAAAVAAHTGLATGDASLQRLLRTLGAPTLEADAAITAALAGLDTPAAYTAALSRS